MPRLVFSGGEFIASSEPTHRFLLERAGFEWDSHRRVWHSKSIGAAYRLRRYAEASAKIVLRRALIQYRPWSGTPPHPKDLTPYPYQPDVARFALSRSRSYLGLTRRAGKTIISALIRNALEAPAVFITPPYLTTPIAADLKKWSTGNPRIEKLGSKLAPLYEPDILVVPDSLIHRDDVRSEIFEFAESVRNIGQVPVLFVDEAHRYKEKKAVRTRSLLGYGKKGLITAFPRQVYLSGTPMPNRPLELYPILSKVAPETIDFMTEEEYGLKYCDGQLMDEICPKCKNLPGPRCYYCKGAGKFENGYDFSGASNLGELRGRVLDKFMLRMTKVPGLPDRVEELVIIGESPARLLKLESKLLAQYSPEDLVAGEVDSEHIATYRKELGRLKIKPALDFLRSLLEDSEESILVFAFHKDVVAGLTEGLADYEPLVIKGGISNESRAEISQIFQTDPKRRVVVANYIAAGLGLTLSKADRSIMVEYSWTPGDNDQASDRANMVNAGKDHLLVQYLVFENSLDRKTMEVNLRKRNVTAYI